MAEVDELTGISLDGFQTEAEPRIDVDTGISLEGFETAPDNIPAVTNIDEKKMNDSIKFAGELNIPPSRAFDMHDSIVKQKEERQKVESLKHERTKLALRGESNILTPDAKAILDGSAAVDPFGVRGLFETSLSLGTGMASFLASFPVGMGEVITQVSTEGRYDLFGISKDKNIDFGRVFDSMTEFQQKASEGLFKEFESLQPSTLSGQQMTNMISFPFQKYEEWGEASSEWMADTICDVDDEDCKSQVRGTGGILRNIALLLAPKAAKDAWAKGKAKIFDSDFYREATIKERSLVIQDYQTLRARGHTEGELARMNPEFFEKSLEKRKATLVDEELARVEEKPVEQVVKERERAELVKSKEPSAIERVAEIDKEIKGITEPIAKKEVELTPETRIGDTTIGEATKALVEGDKSVLPDIVKGIKEHGVEPIQDRVRNLVEARILDKVSEEAGKPFTELSSEEFGKIHKEVQGKFENIKAEVDKVLNVEPVTKKAIKVVPEKPVEISSKQVDAIIEGRAEITEKFEIKPIEIPKEVKETKGVKKRVRLLTGQRKISDLVTEESALKESFKQAQKAARKAFSVGNKEGVAKENLRMKELATRSKARKEASTEVRKMIKNLKKIQKGLDKFHPSFKEPINDLIEGIDLVRLGGKKKVRLQKLSELIETGFKNEVELSDSTINQLRRLDKFNIGDMTFDELSEVHDAIMHLTHLNKLRNEIVVNQKNRKFNEVLTETVAEMKPPKEVAKGIVSSQPGAFKKTREIGQLIKDTFGIRHDAYDLIIESIAGLNSTIEQVLFQAVDDGTDKMVLHKKNTYNKFQADMEGFSERHGVDDIANWLDEPVKVGNFRLTRNERMELFNHSLNPDNKTAILEGGFGFRTSDTPDVIYSMTEAEMNQILDSLTSAEKEFSGKPVRNLFTDQREALNEVFIKRNNYAMPDIENYYPKDVMPIGRKIDETFLDTETALDSLKGQFTRVGINKDHLRPRVGSVAPIYINGLTNTLNKSINHSAAYVGLEIPMANASKLLYNKEFRNEMITRYDRITWQEIEKGLRDIAGDYKSYSSVETLLLRAKNNVATAFLGLNPFVMAKQIISLPLYGTYVKGDFLVQGAMDYMNNTAEIKARHTLYSPKWFERTEGGFSRDVADVFKSGGEKRLFKGKKTIQEATMKGIQLFDEGAVGPGMQGAVLQAISEFQKGKLSPEVKQAINIKDSDIKNLTPEEKMVLAYKFADFATVRTQPMFSPQHRSSLQRGTPLEVLGTMFGSFTNRALNLLRRTYREAKREGSPEANAKFGRALFTVMVINSLAVTAIDSIRDKMRGREITLDKTLTRILTSWTGYFFFLRDISSAISSSLISGNRYSGFDVQLPVQRPVNMTKDVALEGIDLIQAMADNDARKAEEAALRFIDSGIGLALMTKGIPYETPKRFIQDLTGFNKKDKKVKRTKVQRRQ